MEFRVSRFVVSGSKSAMLIALSQALTILLRIVIAYTLLLPLLGVLVVAPWLAISEKWKPVFAAPDTTVSPVWFSFFIVESAFNNCGLR